MRYKLYLLIFICSVATLLSAQTATEAGLGSALALERAGQSPQAIALLETIIASRSANDPVSGQAFDILGLAYKDDANYMEAQGAFERSIEILEHSPAYAREYGMALDNFGGLLLAMGQPDGAERLRERALAVYERAKNHAGAAIALSDLAGMALTQNAIHRARTCLNRAQKEELLATDLDDDNRAAISSMQGWLALRNGNAKASVVAYQRSLDLWKKQRGEQHRSTGWGYILLGNANANAGDFVAALSYLQTGLSILDQTTGRQDAHYLKAELSYAQLLDRTGAHSEAARIKIDAERSLEGLYRSQCAGGTLSASAFR